MKVTERPDLAVKVLADAAEKNKGEPRAEGIHLSDLLVCLRRSFYDKTLGTPRSEAARENLRTMLGKSFHAWLQVEPEQQTLSNGRWHNTDRLTEDSGELIPIEIKSTRYSSAKGLVDYHVDQLAGYCIDRKVKRGQMWVLYMYGDYREHRDPQFVVCDVEFTDAELSRWERILAYRQSTLEDALATGVPPAISQRLGWACKDCCYRGHVCPGGKPSDAAWDTNFAERADIEST